MPRNRTVTVTIAAVLAVTLLFAAGCSKGDEPYLESREALGTVVGITAYPGSSADESATAQAVDKAYLDMRTAEIALDAYANQMWIDSRFEIGYDPAPERYADSIVAFNTSPFLWRILPAQAERLIERVDALGVSEYFSPALFEVTALYGFEASGTVPAPETLDYALDIASTFTTRMTVGAREATFDVSGTVTPPELADDPVWSTPRAGIDLGGAAKGYAIDQAIDALRSSGSIDAALVTAGSTTATYGEKPDGEAWRVGIEHPREPEQLVATVEGTGELTVSTSGDYQRYFERDGVRYHHIIDPATGEPARGIQSLTVIGAQNATDSDILSTALFVMGLEKASAYAEEHGLGLVVVDDQGQVHVVPGPDDRTWEILAEE